MRIINDGHVAISIEIHGGTIRLHPRVPEEGDEQPEYNGGGEFHEVTSDVVKLSAFKADFMTVRHVKLICRAMLDLGYYWLIAERLGKHKLPGSEPVTWWPFEGWQRVDLLHNRLTGRRSRKALDAAAARHQ